MERLPIGVADDMAAGHLVSAPGRRKRRGGSAAAALSAESSCGQRPYALRFQSENASTRRYFNAELLQVPHRISCPAPARNWTTTKPLDNPSTRRRVSSSEASSETTPDPVRPQWGQRSETIQALDAFGNA